MKSTFKLSLLAITTAAVLTACGGGGGGSTATTTPSPTPTPVTPTPTPTPSPYQPIVQTTPPTPTYTGSDLAVFNRLNQVRMTCGFGSVKQDVRLDAAAKGHALWLQSNPTIPSHFENVGSATYSPDNRIALAGYTASYTGEVISGYNEQASASVIDGFMSAPYHAFGVVAGNLDVGFSSAIWNVYGSDNLIAGKTGYIVIDFATPKDQKGQMQNSEEVLTYPCQSITSTATALYTETPSPIPSRDLGTNPIGQPIIVQSLYGNKLVIKTATVTGPVGSVALLPTMTSENDPNKMIGVSQAVIMPDRPLSPNTDYSVVINGTNNTKDFTKSFTFRTGSI